MKTDDLIQELAKDSKPVKRIPSIGTRFLRWLFASVLCLGVGITLFGIRSDIESAATQFNFSVQVLFSFCLAILSALSAFILSVPDRHNPWLDRVPIATLGLWFFIILWSFLFSENSRAGFGVGCMRDLIVLGFLPGALLFFMLRQAAPVQKGKTGFFAALAIASLGAMGTQFICHSDNPLHVLLWHFFPVLLVGSLGFFLGRLLLRWESH